jgi:hypothetical protein
MEKFKQFLLKAPQGGSKKGTISKNTASTYFSVFKAAQLHKGSGFLCAHNNDYSIKVYVLHTLRHFLCNSLIYSLL